MLFSNFFRFFWLATIIWTVQGRFISLFVMLCDERPSNEATLLNNLKLEADFDAVQYIFENRLAALATS